MTPTAGSHRRVDRGRRLQVLFVSLLVVVLAAGGVVAALHWRGESKRPAATAASSGYPRVSPSATPSGATSPAVTPSVTQSAAPPATSVAASVAAPPPATTAPTTAAPATTTSPVPSVSSSAAATKLPVDILNSTHVSGLAARAESTLTRGGWTVALTGNYPHSTSATTVFYPAGQLAAAQALAAQFTAIAKMAVAPAGVSTSDLTLVLAQDWTASGK